MAYGLEIRNADGDLVIDNDNEVVLVAEKNTISGKRTSAPANVYADYGHQWYSYDGNKSYRCCVHLTNNYANPPIVAIRGESGGYNILLPTVRSFSSDGTYVDRLFFRTDFVRSIDYIVCAGASECPSTSRSVGSDTYGLTLKNSSDSVIFDSRWAAIVSCTSLEIFPSGVDVSINAGTGPFNTTITKTTQSVTIPSTPAAFFAITGLTGQKAFYEDNTSGQGGEPIEEYGGGVFSPTLIQTGDTSVTATCIRTHSGVNLYNSPVPYVSAGDNYVNQNYTGNFQVLRYLDF